MFFSLKHPISSLENRFSYSRHRGSTPQRKFHRSSSGSYFFHPIERGPPAVWCFFQVETHVELFWTTARQQRLVQRPELRARIRRRKEKFAFLRDTPPSPTTPSPSFCFSSSVFHSGVYQPGHTELRAFYVLVAWPRFVQRIVVEFLRDNLYEKYFSPSRVSRRRLHITAPSCTRFSKRCRRLARGYTLAPRCAKKTGSRIVAAHFRCSRWKYRTRIRFLDAFWPR